MTDKIFIMLKICILHNCINFKHLEKVLEKVILLKFKYFILIDHIQIKY